LKAAPFGAAFFLFKVGAPLGFFATDAGLLPFLPFLRFAWFFSPLMHRFLMCYVGRFAWRFLEPLTFDF
jgi:hypothetical protein